MVNSLKQSQYKVSEGNINIPNNIKIREKSIYTGELSSKGKIIAYDDIIVLGSIKAEYLLVSGNLICLGEISASEIDIEGDLVYAKEPMCETFNVGGNLTYVELEDSNTGLSINNIDVIKDITKDGENLSFISEYKKAAIEVIAKEIQNIEIDEIINVFKKIQKVFIEFEMYADLLNDLNLIKSRDSIKYLLQYLELIDKLQKIPKWIKDSGAVREKLILINSIDVEKLNYSCNDDEESSVKLHYYLFLNKKQLDNKYNKILNKLTQNKNEANKEEMYYNYIKLKNENKKVIGKIESIDNKYIDIVLNDGINATLITDYLDIASTYKVGDLIEAYILDVVNLSDGDIHINLYQINSYYIANLINKLAISNLRTLNRNQVYKYDNSVFICITSYTLTDEEIKNIEYTLHTKLKNYKFKIIYAVENIEKVLSELFGVTQTSILKDGTNKKYIISVSESEARSKLKCYIEKYKDLISKITAYSIDVNVLSVRNKYNIYTKKINKLINGKVSQITDSGYVVEIEDRVIGNLKKMYSSKKYNLGDEVLAKVESVSLGDDGVKLKIVNDYYGYVSDVISYTIEELHINSNFTYKYEQNKNGNMDIYINFENTDIIKPHVKNISSYILKHLDCNKYNVKVNEEHNENVSNENIAKSINKEVSINDIIKAFNTKKRSCGVPEIYIMKKSRIAGYKTVLVTSNLALGNNKKNLLSLAFDIESEIKSENIKIITINSDVSIMVADILGIEIENVKINNDKRKIEAILGESQCINSVDSIENEKRLIKGIFPYYDIEIKAKKIDEKPTKTNVAKSEEDDIINFLFN